VNADRPWEFGEVIFLGGVYSGQPQTNRQTDCRNELKLQLTTFDDERNNDINFIFEYRAEMIEEW